MNVKYTAMLAIIVICTLFLTGCSEYRTREYVVRSETELRGAFAGVGNNEVIRIILDTDIQLQGGTLKIPTGVTGSTVIITTRASVPNNRPRLITRTYGEARHFYVPPKSTLTIRGAVAIQSHVSTENRGGISVNGGTLNVGGHSVIRNNRWLDGGGVSVENGGTFNITNTGSIIGNIAYRNGGGVFVHGNSNFRVSGSETSNINDNSAGSNGGGVFICGNSNFNMSGVGTINDNMAGGSGGGVFVASGSSFNRSGLGNISRNIALIDGGGILATGQGTRISLSGLNEVSRNTAQRGGGVAILNDAHLSVGGTVSISNNTGGNRYVENNDNDSGSNTPVNDHEIPQFPPNGDGNGMPAQRQ